MRRASRLLSALALACAIGAPLVTTACAEHPYRAYDPYDHQYHNWGPEEQTYYSQWAVEVHINNRPYKKLNHDQQEQYWRWRHDHHDHDHDHR